MQALSLNQLMAELFQEAYRSFDASSQAAKERLGITWAQFHTHLYSNFCSYQYATGIAGAYAG
ncbi:MAG: hypothetical protein R2865_12835 [Deinococcales bacterium]